MPIWSITTSLEQSAQQVFHLLRQPAQRLLLTPPEWRMRQQGGLAYLERGSRLVYQGRRWGLSQTIEIEVIELEPEVLLVEEQRRGPFRRWSHRHSLKANFQGGVDLQEEIDFDPPGGMLGQLLTRARIEEDLAALYRWREPILRELLVTSTEDRSQR